ncbi:MAG: hypothetical protein ACREBI_05135 [Nitrosotalea sp.]
MKWIPSWLAKSYALLNAEKSTEWSDFEEAKKILHIEDTKVLSKRLTKLEESGFLIAKRDSIDRRKKYFRALEPKDVILAYGIRSLSTSDNITDILVSASMKMDFVIGGAYAVYIYSRYASPGKIDIYVKEEDKDKWISLLSDKSISVSVDDVLSEKTARTNVHIHSLLTQEMIDNSLKLDGIRYVQREILVISGLREQSEFSLTDAFAILIKNRQKIDFDKLLKFAMNENLERELGACLEIINLESKKKLFSDSVIHKLRLQTDFTRTRYFPIDRTEKTSEYLHISERYGLQITLPRAFVYKIITDLVR